MGRMRSSASLRWFRDGPGRRGCGRARHEAEDSVRVEVGLCFALAFGIAVSRLSLVDYLLVSAKEPTPRERLDLLQGTLDMLVLRTLVFGPRHGHEISTTIQQQSDDELLVDHGSLYPALQRLQRKGWIVTKWGISDNNRRAKFYTLTRTGRKQLIAETSKWERLTRAVAGVLKPTAEEETP